MGGPTAHHHIGRTASPSPSRIKATVLCGTSYSSRQSGGGQILVHKQHLRAHCTSHAGCAHCAAEHLVKGAPRAAFGRAVSVRTLVAPAKERTLLPMFSAWFDYSAGSVITPAMYEYLHLPVLTPGRGAHDACSLPVPHVYTYYALVGGYLDRLYAFSKTVPVYVD